MPLASAASHDARFAALALAAALASASLAHAGTTPGRLTACTSARRLGPDTTAVGSSRQVGLDRGLAQTFVTADTLVRAVSVWLPGTARKLGFPFHLYVTRADHDGRPLLDDVIADGGTLTTGRGSGMHPARFVFEFTPPLSLPAPGAYAIVFMPDECGIASLLTTAGDLVRDGRLWEVGRHGCLEPAGTVRSEVTGRDLVFMVEFCDRGTDVGGRTWGEIKTQYR